MRYRFTYILSLLLFWVNFVAESQIAPRQKAPASMNAGAVSVSGSTGADGDYTTLKAAFDAINLNPDQAGNKITIDINANTLETATAVLNQPATNSWTSLAISPSTINLKIEGNISAPLINLNGADKVTLDGRVNHIGGKSLTLSNTNTAGQVIQFITDATSNTVRYCTIKGVNTAAASGTIVFGVGDVVGNDNNTIEYCDIRDGATTPTNAIYSAGSSTATDNSGISVLNNNIYNYFSATLSSNGVYIASNSSAWTISNNKFYQTSTCTTTIASRTHRAIYIVTALGIDYALNNNIVGYANENGTGTTTYNGQSTLFRAIEITVGTSSASSIQGNTVSNIDFSTTSGSTTLPGIFSGISVLAGNVNIGTTTGNTIGSTTGNSSILITSTTSLGVITGISATSIGTVEIKGNNIGAISTEGSETIGYNFNGIYTLGTGGNYSISNNIIGSASTPNSISIGDGSTTTPICTMRGIYNAASGTISITGNTVQNCTVYGTGLSVYNGIYNAAGSGTVDIVGNSIISGTNTGTHTSSTVTYFPIANAAAVNTLNITNNTIRNHKRTSTGGFFTAIINSGAVLSNININNNLLGNSEGGLITYTAANTVSLLGISNTGGAASCELSIQNNDIRGINYTVPGTGSHTYIINSAVTLKQNISFNTFTNLNVNTTGTITFISNNVAMPANGVQSIDDNSIVTAFVRNLGSPLGALTLFSSITATNNTNVIVTNNDNNFSNITVSGAATIAGWVNTDAGTGNVDKTIYKNKFENWSGGTGAITALNVNISSETNKTYENTIQNITSNGIIYGIITAAGNDKIYLNTINNLNSTDGVAATIVSGINITAGTIKNVYQNTISNITGNTLTTGSVRGILISAGTSVNVYENKIFGLSANANTTGTLSGIWVTGGSTVNVDRNKIYDISSSSPSMSAAGVVYGIQLSGTTATASLTTNISNNLIGDLKVSASSGLDLIRGIGLTSTGATSTSNVYYNSIYLNAPASSGTNFGTSGVYHTASSSATTATLNLRNNIIINLSAQKGTGTTVAYRRSVGTSNTLSNYASTSKNNLFYAGVPSVTNLIYSDGTSSAQTFAQYKNGIFTAGTIAPRDQVSVSENLDFISAAASSNDFLKVKTSIDTQIESGAVNIPGYTVDYLGVIRQGNAGYAGTSTSGPDIGAYENEYKPTDQSSPSITYTPLIDNSCLSNKTIVATISDATGVNVTAGTRPRIYFKKLLNNNVLPITNDNTTNGWKYIETSDNSNPFTFSIDYTLLSGGVTTGDVIQYFVTAQDIVNPSPYVGINTGVFTSTPTSVVLTSAAFPINGTINSFKILAGLSGTVNVGTGQTYTTLTGSGPSGLFETINKRGLAGDLIVNITSNITELGTTSLDAIKYGCNAYNTLTILPSGGAARFISGDKAGGALLNFNGADYIIIDGLNTGGNSLTISNISTSNTSGTSTIRFINDATNNIVRKCSIEGSSTLLASGTIVFSTGASTGNNNNTISNNTIRAVGTNLPTNAIYSAGSSIIVSNNANIIDGNNIQDYYNPALASNGVYIASNSSAWTINNNKFFQTGIRTATVGNIHRGINIITALGVDYTINNNTIGYANANATGTTVYDGAFNNRFLGIEMNVGVNSISNVQGNKIAGINFSNTLGTANTKAPGIFTGISVLGGKVDIGNTIGNTIGESTGNGSITINSNITANYIAGIYTTSTSVVNIKKNKIGSISIGGAPTIGYTFYGINTVGGGQYTISDNIIGSLSTENSLSVGVLGATTTGVCSLYGIYNTATGGISISANTIQNVSTFGTSASMLTAILNAGVSGNVSIDNNNIVAVTTTGTGTITGISNNAAATVLSISSNKIRNLTKSVATGAVTAISNSGIVLSGITIDGNQLGNTDGDLINYSVSNSGILTGISNTGGSANCALSIQNNDVRRINYAFISSSANNYIINSATTLSQNISGNTFTALNVNTTGAIILISNNVAMPVNGVQNINNNSIATSFTRAAPSGALTLFTSTTATNNNNVTVTNNGNNFSNITLNGTASIAGWVNTDAGVGLVNKTISENKFENWTAGTGSITAMNINITSTSNATTKNTIRNISSVGTIYGIITAGGNDKIYGDTIHSLISTGATSTIVNGIAITTTGISKNIYQNTIYNLQANNITTGSVSGIAITGGSVNNIYRNKIYNISSASSILTSGSINGILISGTVSDLTNTIYNNRIGNITAPAANVVDNVRGISVSNTGLRSTNNIYYNTVYLNASSTGTNFGSTGIYHASNATSTTGALNLRNNIIVNFSTKSGTGITVAFRQSSGAVSRLGNYQNTSNNNLFYAGDPDPSRLIYSNGVNTALDIEEYRTGNFTAGVISPRDNLSISENPHFISTDGASTDFLKFNTNTITFIESGAVNIADITTDFDGRIRAGNPGFPVQVNGAGTAPDIGAEEFDGRLPNIVVSNSNVSSNGSYAKLAEAFSAINAHNQSLKDVVVSIIGSTTESTAATLNEGAWTTLKVYTTKAGLTVSGNLSGVPVVNLNGADNVTFDGRLNQTGTIRNLSITNTSISADAGTSTIRFINSAENNTLKYLNIQGSSQSSTDGIVVFSTSAAGNGNDINILEYNNITNSSGNRPVNSIYSLGFTGSENSTNTIRYNNIFDFLSNTATSNGISLNAFSTDWIITNNSFYETTDLTPSAGTIQYSGINIDNPSGINFNISNNFFGGKASSCGGGAFTVNSSTNHSFKAIYLNVGTSAVSSLQSNIIRNFNYNTSSETPWRAIEIIAGSLNIGTATANVIGATTGNSSISVTSTSNAQSFGIYLGSEGTVTISKNIIGAISLYGNNTNASHSFSGIYKKSGIAGSAVINNNIIGSTTTSNSIFAASTASSSTIGQNLSGVFLESTGTNSISNNSIANLQNNYEGTQNSRTVGVYSTAGSSTLVKNFIYNLSSAALSLSVSSVSGIIMDSIGTNTITETQIYNLSNSNPTFSGFITGIIFSGGVASNLVNRNFIRNLSVNVSSSTASIYGIRINKGVTTFSNNIITLGGNTTTTIYGIFSSGITNCNPNLYFNTVFVNGSLGSGTTTSYAFYEATNNGIRDIRNNIFSNFRSTNGGANLHYSAYLNYTSATNLTLDYNLHWAPNTGGVLGYYNGSIKIDIPIVSMLDTSSVKIDPRFQNYSGPLAGDYKAIEPSVGAYGTGITLDYGQNARSAQPNIGAWELNANQWLGTLDSDFAKTGNWSAGSVPLEEASVVFAAVPLNDCILDHDRIVGNIVNAQATYKFIINGKKLTLLGGLFLSNRAKIDATAASSSLIFEGEDAQIISDSTFFNNTIPNLTINNIYGVINECDLLITETLNLLTPNPSDIKGSLHTPTKTVTLSENVVTMGDGDATGITKRTSLSANVNYTFGNKNAGIYFENTGTLPTEISVKMAIGSAPSWKNTAVKRIYDIIQTGANPLSPTSAIIKSTYLDSELNGNFEKKLVNFSFRGTYPNGMLIEHGRASNDSTENWLKLTNVNMAFFPATFDSVQIGIAKNEIDTLTWNGSASTSWTTVNNWTPLGGPSDFINIIIPDAASTTFDPILPPETTINSLKFKNGSVLNSIPAAQLKIEGGINALLNEGGTFNPSTSNVTFTNDAADFTGETNFYNLSIDDGAVLQMKENSYMRIASAITNNGILRTSLGDVHTTVEYNGADQTVIIPNAATNRYYNLVLSGSGVKTMPSNVISILGDFKLLGTASVTALNNFVVGNDLAIGVDAIFNANGKQHTIGGDLIHDGVFTCFGSLFTFNGLSVPQTISGTATSTDFCNLTISNSLGVNSIKNISVNTVLNLQAQNPTDLMGCLNMDLDKTLTLNQNETTIGIGDVTGIVKRSHTFNSNQSYTYGNKNTFLTFDEIGTKPTEISIKTTIGNTPAWKAAAIKRIYDFAQTGGINCNITVNLNYQENELNNCQEDELVIFGRSILPTPTIYEWGQSSIDENENRISLDNVNVELWPTAFGQMEITIGETGHPDLIWNGSQSSDWNNYKNWTPSVFPNRLTILKIPDASTTNNDPILPLNADAHRLVLETGAILNGSNNGKLNLYNYHGGIVWENKGGTFNPSTTNINFMKPLQKISGNTNFYNLTISLDADLTLENNCIIGIAGTLVNDGILEATKNINTIDFNGSEQSIEIPNGIIPGFSNLKLSGSSVKTLPSNYMDIFGNLTVDGSAIVTPNQVLSIAGSIAIGASAQFETGLFTHLIGGNFTSNGLFKATSGSNLILNGIAVQTMSGTSSPTFENLTISNPIGGVVSITDISVNGILNLSSNPTNLKGSLDMNNTTLYMNATATTIGLGDVTGVVRREHIFNNSQDYSFGNPYTTLNFLNVPGNTKPAWISCKISIGTSPSWKNAAIKRYYSFAQSGGDDRLIVKLHYLDSELNSLDETQLVYWDGYDPDLTAPIVYSAFYPRNKNGNSTTNNWIQLTGPAINYLATSSDLDVKQWGLGYSNVTKHTWTGNGSPSYDGDWSLPGNWDGGVPQETDSVFIPIPTNLPLDNNGDFSPYRNLLPIIAPAVAKTLEIAEGANLQLTTDYDITIFGSNNAWVNNGTFTPGTATVSFSGANATIAGTTDFYNLTVNPGAKLTQQSGATTRVANAMINNGPLDASTNPNTFVYNGANQTVLNLVAGLGGYYHLTLTGTGTKTILPTVGGIPLKILGNLTLDGTASTVAVNQTHIGGDLSIGSTSSFTTGAYSHNIGGNLTNNGNLVISTGNTINLNGTSNQSIGGLISTNFKNLILNNSAGATLGNNQSIEGFLNLQNGILNTSDKTLTLSSSSAPTKGTGMINAGSGTLSFTNPSAITLPASLFSGIVNNLTLNGAGVNLGSETTVSGLLALTAGTLTTATQTLTLSGNLPPTGSGKIDAILGTLAFTNSAPITLPTSIFLGNLNNLTLNGLGGITFGNSTTVTGILTLTSGILTTGVYTLTLGSSASLSGGSSTSFINGKLARVFSSTGSKTFPIGKIGAYRPLTFEYTTLLGPNTVTAEQFETKMLGTLPDDTFLDSARFWTISQSDVAANTFNLTLDGTGYSYLPLEPRILQNNGSITAHVATVSASNFTTTGLNSLGDFSLGNAFLPPPTTQAHSISFNPVAATTFTVNWTKGNGTSRAVFMKEGTGAISNPKNGTGYISNNNWSSKGDQLGVSGYFCIYKGTDNTIDLTNLLPKTTYTVQVFENFGTDASASYQVATATNNPNFQLTWNDPSIADYQSKQTGIFNVKETWEYNNTGLGWANAIQAPTADNNLSILPAHDVSLIANTSLNTAKTISIDGIFTMNSNVLSGTGNLILGGTGTIKIGSLTGVSGNITLSGTVDVGNGTLEFNGASAQSQAGGVFNNVIVNNASGVSLSADMAVNSALTLTTGALAIASNTLTLNGTITQSLGSLTGGVSSNLIIGGSGSSTTLPTVANGLNNLTLDRSNGLSLGGDLSVLGTLLLSNGTLTTTGNILNLSGNSPSRTSGFIDASNALATLAFTNPLAITLPASLFTGNLINNLTLNGNGGVSLGSATTVAGALTLTAGALTTGANTFTLSGSSPTRVSGTIDASNAGATMAFTNSNAMTLPASIFTDNVNNMVLNGLGGVFLGSSTTISSLLNLNMGNLTIGANTLTLSGISPTRGLGAIDASNLNATMAFNNNSSAIVLPSSLFTSNVNNLTINGTAGVTLGSATTVSGLIALTTGTLTTDLNILTLSGNSAPTGSGTINAGLGTVVFSNANAITLPATLFTGSIKNLTTNGGAEITLGSDATVTGILALTSGILTTGNHSIILESSADYTGGLSSSSYINGKLARVFSATGSKTFPIGKTGVYRPLTFNYTSLTGTSTVTAEQFETTIPGNPPTNSNVLNTFNRHWTLNQTGGSAVGFKVTLDGTGWTPTRTANMIHGDGITNNAVKVTIPTYTSSDNFTTFGNFSLGEVSVSWNGVTNNDWFTPSNWSSSTVPTPNDYIIVPTSTNYPTIGGISPTNDITLNSTSKLEIQNGAQLTLDSIPVLKFESGANVTTGTAAKIILKSGATYLNLSNSSPVLEVQRKLSGTKGWRMVSSPVATKFDDMFKSPLVTQGFTGANYPLLQPNLLWWDETDPGTTLQSWRKPAKMDTSMVSGSGYFHYVFKGAGISTGGTYSDVLPQTMTVTGIEKSVGSAVNFGITHTTRTAPTSGTNYLDVNILDQGWNLIGNPTASTLDWDAVGGWTKTNVDNSIYIWDPSANSGNGNYITWNGDVGTVLLDNGKIAPFQAFWVRANVSDPLLTPALSFNNNAKVASISTFYRAPADNKPFTVPVKLEYNELNTTSFVSLSNTGITGPDRYDAYQLEPMTNTWLELYTLSSTDHISPLVINNLPVDETSLINIPLFVDGQIDGVGIKGKCTLKWSLPENWPSDWYINLQDNANFMLMSMNDFNEYKFDFNSATSGNTASTNMFTPKQVVSKNSSSSNKTNKNLPPYSIIISKGKKLDQFIDPLPKLISNYPNPFSTYTIISYSLPKPSQVQIDIYDLRGGKIKTLTNAMNTAGYNEVTWNPENLLPGIYLIRFISDNNVSNLKAILK